MRIIVRSPNWVGDATLATAAVRRLRQRMPNAYLAVAASNHLVPLYQGLADLVMAIPAKSEPQSLKRTVMEVKKFGADAALILPSSFRTALEMKLAGIPLRFGYADDYRSGLLNPRVQRNENQQLLAGARRVRYQRHVYLEWLELADQLCDRLTLNQRPETLPRPFVMESVRGREEADKVVRSLFGSLNHVIVGLNPLSRGGITRNWPLKKWIALIHALQRQDVQCVVFGGPDDAKPLEELHAGVGPESILLAGSTALSLSGFRSFVKYMDAFITNDTGLMHVAAAAWVPIVAIFGSTLPELTGPITTHGKVLHRAALPCAGCYEKTCRIDVRCLQEIGVDEVLSATFSLLAERSELELA